MNGLSLITKGILDGVQNRFCGLNRITKGFVVYGLFLKLYRDFRINLIIKDRFKINLRSDE